MIKSILFVLALFLLATQLHDQYAALQARDSLHLAVIQRHGIFRIISANARWSNLSHKCQRWTCCRIARVTSSLVG